MKTVRILAAALALTLCACGSDKTGGSQWPKGFDAKSDSEKVAYVMERVGPDSVARFICAASLGHVEGAKINSLADATLYAYEHYKQESDLQSFANAYDDYTNRLALADKMKLMQPGGSADPQAIGYQLGLEYVDMIRSSRKNAQVVTEEVEAFRKACASDTAMFRRFLTGFKVALDVDKGKDLPNEIYLKFKNYK